jgi:hypothetical protein
MFYARFALLALMVSAPHAWTQVQFQPYSKAAALHSATEVLESAIQALDGVKSMEYEVHMLPAAGAVSNDIRFAGRTTVIGTVGSPIRYRVDFIKKHPEYRFTYLTDPNLEDSHSKIARFFAGEGIPRSVFAGPDGKIVDYVYGSYAGHEDELLKRVDQWLK